jgi:putative IMPACT (imprinted ancient) family translation regulator
MNKIYRKELSNMQTHFLLKLKNTLFEKMNYKILTKDYSNMLIDVLGELDTRRLN